MSTKTKHYQLNQYEPGDNFLRTDFNEDNAKIDAAILAATPVVGTYEGTGGGMAQTIHLGFRPKAVLVTTNEFGFHSDLATFVGLCVPGGDNQYLTITDTGFRVSSHLNSLNDRYNGTSFPHNPYRYIAWR